MLLLRAFIYLEVDSDSSLMDDISAPVACAMTLRTSPKESPSKYFNMLSPNTAAAKASPTRKTDSKVSSNSPRYTLFRSFLSAAGRFQLPVVQAHSLV
jgi:hypothetical protein